MDSSVHPTTLGEDNSPAIAGMTITNPAYQVELSTVIAKDSNTFASPEKSIAPDRLCTTGPSDKETLATLTRAAPSPIQKLQRVSKVQSPKFSPRWKKTFIVGHVEKDSRGCKSSRFISKQDFPYKMSPIDTTVGQKGCLERTSAQWNSVIKESLNPGHTRKIPAEVRAVRFHELVRPIRPEGFAGSKHPPSKKSWACETLITEKSLNHDLEGLPIPLEAYGRLRKMALRKRIASAAGVGDHHFSADRKFHDRPEKDGNMEFQTYVRRGPNWMDLAAEEHLNDYELIKGKGKIPINRRYDHANEITIANKKDDELLKIMPGSYGWQDHDFPLSQIQTYDAIFEAPIKPGIALDMSQVLTLRWRGKSGQLIKLTKGEDTILEVLLQDIRQIYYNKNLRNILLYHLNKDATVTETLFKVTEDTSSNDWMVLQPCLYSTGKVDSNTEEFFQDKAKLLRKLRKAPSTKAANRGLLDGKQKTLQVVQSRKQKSSIFNHIESEPSRVQNSLKEGNKDDGEHLKASEPTDSTFSSFQIHPAAFRNSEDELESIIKNLASSSNCKSSELTSGESLKSESREGSPINSQLGEARDSLRKEKENETSDKTQGPMKRKESNQENETTQSLFYDGKTDAPIPVCIGDHVVRLRSKEGQEKGKRNKHDIFDGPWVVTKFDGARKLYSVSKKCESKEAWMKMLTCKVALRFPKDSQALSWVEIGQLIPLIGPQDVTFGSVLDSCLAVAEHPEFKRLKTRVEMKDENDLTGVVEIEERSDLSALYLAQVKPNIFIGVIEVAPKGISNSDRYEVDKLRAKRLRIFKKDSKNVKDFDLQTDHDDEWVQRFQRECPNLCKNRIIVSEFLVHWAGWAEEDMTWALGTNNIPDEFINDFNTSTDPFRDVSLDTPISNPEDIVYEEDLKAEKRAHKSNSTSKSSSHNRFNGVKKKGGKSQSTENRKRVRSPNSDSSRDSSSNDKVMETVLDSEDEDLAMALQASMEDPKTRVHFDKHQKEFGVTRKAKKQFQPSVEGELDDDVGIPVKVPGVDMEDII